MNQLTPEVPHTRPHTLSLEPSMIRQEITQHAIPIMGPGAAHYQAPPSRAVPEISSPQSWTPPSDPEILKSPHSQPIKKSSDMGINREILSGSGDNLAMQQVISVLQNNPRMK
jgi:hypothetical protein